MPPRLVILLPVTLFLLGVAVFGLPAIIQTGYAQPELSPTSAHATPHQVERYSTFLTTLSDTDPEAVLKAAEAFKRLFQTTSTTTREQGFEAFMAWYTDVLRTLQDNRPLDGLDPVGWDQLATTAQTYAQREFDVRYLAGSETPYYLDRHDGFLLTHFGPLLGPAWQRFLEWRAQVQKQGFADHATGIITVEWDVIRQRIVWLSQFLNDHPHFKEHPYLERNLRGYCRTYVLGKGTGTLPTVSWSDRHLRDEVLKSYQQFSPNPTFITGPYSQFQQLIATYLVKLSGTHYQLTDALSEWLIAEVDTLLGVNDYTHSQIDIQGYPVDHPLVRQHLK